VAVIYKHSISLQRLAGNSLPNLRSSGATVLDQTPPHHWHSTRLRETKSKDVDSKWPSSSAALSCDKQHSSPGLSSASAFYSNVVTQQVAKACEQAAKRTTKQTVSDTRAKPKSEPQSIKPKTTLQESPPSSPLSSTVKIVTSFLWTSDPEPQPRLSNEKDNPYRHATVPNQTRTGSAHY